MTLCPVRYPDAGLMPNPFVCQGFLARIACVAGQIFARAPCVAGLLRKLETVLREDETAELPAIAAELETCWSATRKELMECRDDMTAGDGNGNMGGTRVQIG